MVEVEGVVLQDGKPLERIMVEFWPETDGSRSFGTTDATGKFVLTTDDGERLGAVVGRHRVVLKDASVLGDKFLGRAGEDVPMGTGKKSRIDGRYGNVTTTPLTQDVAKGEKLIAEFDAKQRL